MVSKLKYPIKLDEGKVIKSVKEEKIFFEEREKNIRNKFYSRSGVREENKISSSSSNLCYGIELI